MEMFLPLMLLLAAARIGGDLSARLGQAPMAGEIGGGIVLAIGFAWVGPEIGLSPDIFAHSAVEHVVDLGIFLLILSAGIEMQPREISRGSLTSFSVALGGVLVPLAAGMGLGWLILPDTADKPIQMLVIGVALSISAVPAAIEILRELGMLHHRIGRTVVSAAIFDDVLGLMLLTILITIARDGELPAAETLVLVVVKAAAFFAIAIVANVIFYRRLSRKLHLARSAPAALSAILFGAFLLAVLAEALGFHFILGPFVVGLFFEKAKVGRTVFRETREAVELVGRGFLIPIFFAFIGTHIDLSAVAAIPGTILALIVIAFLGKVVGGGLPAVMASMPARDAAAVGTALSARGMVELVVLSIALKAGVFLSADSSNGIVTNLFSALAITAVVTTILAPVALRALLARHPRQQER